MLRGTSPELKPLLLRSFQISPDVTEPVAVVYSNELPHGNLPEVGDHLKPTRIASVVQMQLQEKGEIAGATCQQIYSRDYGLKASERLCGEF